MSKKEDLKVTYEDALKKLTEIREAEITAKNKIELNRAKDVLKKYSTDKTFKLIDSNRGEGWSWHKFEGPEENCPTEIRRPIVTIALSDGTDRYSNNRVSKSYRRESKFPCVNGPLAGHWVTDAVDYQLFNSSVGGRRPKKWGKKLTAVFVHIPSIKEPA